MPDHLLGLAAVTVVGAVEQAYFSMQVIQARRKFSVAPPSTAGPPQFERILRAQVNCSEYFPLFIVVLWTCGLFCSPGISFVSGVAYLVARWRYFHGYCQSPERRLAPLHFSAWVLWLLISCSCLGIFGSFCRVYLDLDLDLLVSMTTRLGQTPRRD